MLGFFSSWSGKKSEWPGTVMLSKTVRNTEGLLGNSERYLPNVYKALRLLPSNAQSGCGGMQV